MVAQPPGTTSMPGGTAVNPDSGDDESVPDNRDYLVRERPLKRRIVYDPDAENRRLALQILTGLVLLVLLAYLALDIVAIQRGGDDKLLAIGREFLALTFSPLIALFGTAIAYYYTSR